MSSRSFVLAMVIGLAIAANGADLRSPVKVEFSFDGSHPYVRHFTPTDLGKIRASLESDLTALLKANYPFLTFTRGEAEYRVHFTLTHQMEAGEFRDAGVLLSLGDGTERRPERTFFIKYRSIEEYTTPLPAPDRFILELKRLLQFSIVGNHDLLITRVFSRIPVSKEALHIGKSLDWALPFSASEFRAGPKSLFDIRAAVEGPNGREDVEFTVVSKGTAGASLPEKYRGKTLAETVGPTDKMGLLTAGNIASVAGVYLRAYVPADDRLSEFMFPLALKLAAAGPADTPPEFDEAIGALRNALARLERGEELGAVGNQLARALETFPGVPPRSLALPRASPKATVSQDVGLTTISIAYSRPGVQGRQIFGSLIPYGNVWRAGANEATTIEFSDPVNVEGHALPAGRYAFFAIPSEDEWTVILNRGADQWGSFSYDAAKDAVRFNVKPSVTAPTEWLRYTIDPVSPTAAVVTVNWERSAIRMNVAVDVWAKIDAALAAAPNDPAALRAAARWALQSGERLDAALGWIERVVEVRGDFSDRFLKAQLLAKIGRTPEAIRLVHAMLVDARKRGLSSEVAALEEVLRSMQGHLN